MMKQETILAVCEALAKNAKDPRESSDYRRGVRDVIGELAQRTIRDHRRLSARLNAIYVDLL